MRDIFRSVSITTFMFLLSACGVNKSAQFTGKAIPGAKEENLTKEMDPSTTATSNLPVVAAVAPELAPNPPSPSPTNEPPQSSISDSSDSNQVVTLKGISSEDAPSVPPTSVSGSFLLECLVSQGNPDLLYVSVICRVLKGGLVQPSVGKLPTDWQISSTDLSNSWDSVPRINVPTLPGVWNADFPLPVDKYIGRGVRVKNPENVGWIETTLKAGGSFSGNGFASLATLGTISIGGTEEIRLADCSGAIEKAKIHGTGVRTLLTVHSPTGAVNVSLRGLCGSNRKSSFVIPGRFIVKAVDSDAQIMATSLNDGDYSSGSLSLKEGTYEISFETIYNSKLPGDPYDNIGFQSLTVMPIEGKLSSTKFEFFKR